MKRLYTTIVAVFAIAQFSYAQWTTSGSNIYNSNLGNVGIKTDNPLAPLHIAGNFMTAGSAANVDGTNLNFLSNSAQMLVAWNRSGGSGEIDFISN